MAQEIKKSKQLEDEKAFIENQTKKLKAEKERHYKDWMKARNPLQKKLDDLDKPFRKVDSENKEMIEDNQRMCWDIACKITDAKDKELLQRDFNAEVFTVDTMFSLIRHKKIGIGNRIIGDKVTLKKTLQNGVKIFRDADDYQYLRFFFVKGNDVVGYWVKRKSEHRGDETKSRAWIGHRFLTDDNHIEKEINAHYKKEGTEDYHLEFEEGHPFYRKGSGWRCVKTDPTINQFMNYVEGCNPDSFEAINLDDEGNRKILKRYDYY